MKQANLSEISQLDLPELESPLLRTIREQFEEAYLKQFGVRSGHDGDDIPGRIDEKCRRLQKQASKRRTRPRDGEPRFSLFTNYSGSSVRWDF